MIIPSHFMLAALWAAAFVFQPGVLGWSVDGRGLKDKFRRAVAARPIDTAASSSCTPVPSGTGGSFGNAPYSNSTRDPLSGGSAGGPLSTGSAGGPLSTGSAGGPLSTGSAGDPLSASSPAVVGQPLSSNDTTPKTTASSPDSQSTPNTSTGDPLSTSSPAVAGQPVSSNDTAPITTAPLPNSQSTPKTSAGDPLSTSSPAVAGQPVSSSDTAPRTTVLPPPPPPINTASTPLSTFTSLPPGASILTLPIGKFTSDQFITTVLPGSSTSTIVPVIIPRIGSPIPVICIGCPDGIINLPGSFGSPVCFELFGLKIGSCPPDIVSPNLPPPPPPINTISTPLSTFTSLPPGASILTLPIGKFTSDQFITTILPGSSTSTIVPVIIPIVGPPIPVICIGCPDGIINLPDLFGGLHGLCFELFGLKIGSCPPDITSPPPPPPINTALTPLPTFTILPPGASILTLPIGKFTSDQFITTTLPGSSTSTIVPVIIPVVGPPIPVICIGCPNGIFNIPDLFGGLHGLCFELFGFKIGSCPPDITSPPPPPPINTASTPTPTTTEKPTTHTSSTSSSLCIATFETFFCTKTTVTNVDKRGSGCSSTIFSSLVPCSATGITTTTTTTTVVTETPYNIACGPGTCRPLGPDVCDNPGKKNSKRALNILKYGRDVSIVARAAPQRISNPPPGKVATPANYQGNNQGLFIRGEISRLATSYGLLPLSSKLTNSILYSWENQPLSMGLSGLYGCIAMVAVSEKAGYMARFWEIPYFTGAMAGAGNITAAQAQALFQTGVLDGIQAGRPGDASHLFGLAELRNSLHNNPVFGEFFDDRFNPQVYLIVPHPRLPAGTPEALRTARNAGANLGLAYPDKINQMVALIRQIFNNPQFRVQTIPYSPMMATDAEMHALTSPIADTMQVYVEARLADDFYDSPRGKALLQFEPTASCYDPNKYFLWIEDQPLNGRRHHWFQSGVNIHARNASADETNVGSDTGTNVGSDTGTNVGAVCAAPPSLAPTA